MALNTLTPSRPEWQLYHGGVELRSSHVLEIQRSAGGAAGDRCEVHLERTAALMDSKILFEPQEIEIYQTKKTGGGSTRTRVFWGWTSGVILSLSTEEVVFEARVARFHLGKPLEGMDEYRRSGDGYDIATVEDDLVFNPFVDGVVRGNMRGDAADGFGKRALFLDPDSVRTRSARSYQRVPWIDDDEFDEAADARKWTLAKAVHYLCWTLNAEETYVDNPSLTELEELFGTATTDLRDVRLPLGRYLSEALDDLLRPLGYGWHISYVPAKPLLRFFGRGRGREKAVKLMRPGAPFDWGTNDLTRMQLACGYQSLVNEVLVLGDFEQVEATIQLFPAWDPKYDLLDGEGEVTWEDLAKGATRYLAEPELQRVGRDFVANEAGDYNGLRKGLGAPLDMRKYFGGGLVAKRRRLHPCITLADDKTPIGQNGYLIEWRLYDTSLPASISGDPPWRPLEELLNAGSVHVLRNEIGIRFDGDLPPDDVLANMGKIQFRITGTLFGDRRVRGLARRRDSSPQPLTVRDVVKEERTFQSRYIGAGSKFFRDYLRSKLPGGDKLANDAVDDADAAAAHAERLRGAWDQADVSGALTVALIDGEEYELGDVIIGVAGRALSFAAAGEGARYPQVIGIRYDFVTQTRTLTLSTMRDGG